MNHHATDIDFRGNAGIQLSKMSLEWLFLPRFRKIDIGSLVNYLVDNLHIQYVSQVQFTLVNVSSVFSGFSRGIAEPPPKECLRANGHLHVTFALKRPLTSNFALGVAGRYSVERVSNQVTFWGSLRDPRMFMTVGIPSTICSEVGITTLQHNEMTFLYTVLGVIFRSITITGHFYEEQRVSEYTYSSPITALSSKYLNRPMSTIVRMPYKYWVFNKSMWRHAPNLLSKKHITDLTCVYYFLYISSNLRPHNVPPYDGLHTMLGTYTKDRLFKKLFTSLLSFVQNVNAKTQKSTYDDLDMVVPNVLESMMLRGSNDIDSYEGMQDVTNYMITHFRVQSVDAEGLFSPYDKTVTAMLVNSPQLADRMLQNVSLANSATLIEDTAFALSKLYPSKYQSLKQLDRQLCSLAYDLARQIHQADLADSIDWEELCVSSMRDNSSMAITKFANTYFRYFKGLKTRDSHDIHDS